MPKLKLPRRTRPGRAPTGRRARVALIVAIAVAAGLAGVSWHAHHGAQQRDAAARHALGAATAAAQAIFSYDYRSFDTSVSNGQTFATGQFAKEYAQTTAALKANAVSEKAVVRATVSATGVVSARADRVELLLFLNQYRRNANITGEKVDQNRVTLTMVPVHGEWKVAQATAI
jgi:Mce-associated membrane protein